MDVETDVTNYDMDNHGPCITIEEDVKLTDNVNNALNAINSKEIDTFLSNFLLYLKPQLGKIWRSILVQMKPKNPCKQEIYGIRS